MPKSKPLPTQQQLHELFACSMVTGLLYWKKKTNQSVVIGSKAGWVTSTGYRKISIDGVQYLSHRLIWCWVTGEDPGTAEIDHINGDRSCSAWHNLRKATRAQNAHNSTAKGYYYIKSGQRKKRWCAEISIGYTKIPLGYFLTEAEAAAAYKKASLKYHGEFSRYSNE
jgi:hypothetical protein